MITIERNEFSQLLNSLKEQKYTLIGPVARGTAIVLEELHTIDDLPAGYESVQAPGKYQLLKNKGDPFFGYTTGPQSWKQFLFPPSRKLCSWQRQGKQFSISTEDNSLRNTKYAFIGVRPCDLHAILIQDKIFASGSYADPHYKSLRERAFIVTVNCTQAGGTCFCASTQTGPRATYGFDLALTEIVTGKKHYFVVETGSDRGEKIIGKISHRKTNAEEQSTAERMIDNAKKHMGRELNTNGIRDSFLKAYDHSRWDNVAQRCLSCTNCTMVCPTCFCSTIEDVTDLTGSVAERWRKWDSCFTMDFSYIHGGSVRTSVKARYRQWITHKLATWIDQFGTLGCVGCGRCITWCPVGIDITEEAKAIQEPTTAGK